MQLEQPLFDAAYIERMIQLDQEWLQKVANASTQADYLALAADVDRPQSANND